MNELASKLGVKARTVTELVDALERDKLLMRLPDPSDRRATLVTITEQTRTYADRAQAIQIGISEKLMEPLAADQRAQLYDLLTALVGDRNFDFVC